MKEDEKKEEVYDDILIGMLNDQLVLAGEEVLKFVKSDCASCERNGDMLAIDISNDTAVAEHRLIKVSDFHNYVSLTTSQRGAMVSICGRRFAFLRRGAGQMDRKKILEAVSNFVISL